MSDSLNSGSDAPQTIREMVELEQREKVRMTVSDHIADWVTNLVGSMPFVWLNFAWFIIWMVLNGTGVLRFDPFPFGLLTMIVSLEAIGLAIFVLISQNRQALIADKRAKLDLQINLIAEQEVTKLIEMVSRIEKRLGTTNGFDPDLARMGEPTHVRQIADQMEELERRVDEAAAKGPKSAVNTEA